MKSVVTSLAALAIVGGAAAGMAAVAAPVEVQLAAVGAPLPLDPPPPPAPAPVGPGLPTPDQLSNLCIQATDPGVGYTTKVGLVENGINPDEGHVADHDLRKAYRNGNFPETFTVTNIVPAGPNTAAAQVAITGPKFAGPVTKQLVFVQQGGNWVLQHDAALALLQAAAATD
jgi:hypothetical protein